MKTTIIPSALVAAIGLAGLTMFEAAFAEVVIGMNAPSSGPYWRQGHYQRNAARLAVDEINAAGGILGEPIELVVRDSKSKVADSEANVADLIDNANARMVFGGSSSAVAIAAGKVCKARGVPFFGTLTYSTETTGSEGHRYIFRECNDSWMAAKALANYLNEHFPASKNRYFFITADYTWGHTTEASVRKLTGTEDEKRHPRSLVPFPRATDLEIIKGAADSREVKSQVIVLSVFGSYMEKLLVQLALYGSNTEAQIVVPNITLGMAKGAGPRAMEGVIGTTPWSWRVPEKYDYPKGQAFVDAYEKAYRGYPSTSAASAYTILHEYKAAVERAGSFDAAKVIPALEGHTYRLLKDDQTWREFDHQSVQSVYLVKGRKEQDVVYSRHEEDVFEILAAYPGEELAITREEWEAVRKAAGKPLTLGELEAK